MIRFAFAAALAVVSVGLGGCLSTLGRTAVGPLKPMEVGIQQSVTCSDLVRAIRAAADKVDQSLSVGGDAGSDTVERLRLKNVELLKTIAQADAAYEACEKKEASQRVTIDVEAARRLGVAGLLPGGPS
jgi:hypothetical protein